jgi:hypothetical protein
MNFLAFDLELDGSQILCASTWRCGGEGSGKPRLWAQQDADMRYSNLGEEGVTSLLQYLQSATEQGAVLVTWGGTASDWKFLHQAVSTPELKQAVRKMAREHVDIPLLACASSGMMMGLAATLQGMNMGAAWRGIESSAVPAFWRSRELPLQSMVLQHVAEDAYHTGSIYMSLLSQAQFGSPVLTWVTQRNKARSLALQRFAYPAGGFGLPAVEACISWPPPRTDFPVPSQFQMTSQAGWLQEDAPIGS